MRFIYSILFYLAIPFVVLRLLWRSREQPAYRKRFAERFGFYPRGFEKTLWVHAVSVGEAIAAIPLVKMLKARYPELPILITTMTPTGAARVKSAFGDTVVHAFIPYDLPTSMRRFVNTFNPVVCVIMETELWPNLIAACAQKKIPICLVNARLSPKSAAGYQRIAGLTREMLARLTLIASHGEADAERFIALGADPAKVTVTGNIKFDMEVPAGLQEKADVLRNALGKDRFVWIAASTHEGEEEIILAAHQMLRKHRQDALLILVPRHPDRFDAIADLCRQQFSTVRRSLNEVCESEVAVYLGDTMGELLLLYAAADVAFVGGSLIPRGGHNMLEPGILGKPILTGPHLFNFAEISELFFAANAMQKVTTATELADALLALQRDSTLQAKMIAAATQVVMANRGALQQQVELIAGALSS